MSGFSYVIRDRVTGNYFLYGENPSIGGVRMVDATMTKYLNKAVFFPTEAEVVNSLRYLYGVTDQLSGLPNKLLTDRKVWEDYTVVPPTTWEVVRVTDNKVDLSYSSNADHIDSVINSKNAVMSMGGYVPRLACWFFGELLGEKIPWDYLLRVVVPTEWQASRRNEILDTVDRVLDQFHTEKIEFIHGPGCVNLLIPTGEVAMQMIMLLSECGGKLYPTSNILSAWAD